MNRSGIMGGCAGNPRGSRGETLQPVPHRIVIPHKIPMILGQPNHIANPQLKSYQLPERTPCRKGRSRCHMKSASSIALGRMSPTPLMVSPCSRATAILMPVAPFVRATASGTARLTSQATAPSATSAISVMGAAGSKRVMIWCHRMILSCQQKAIRNG
jgi:hypothetical protein